ncbi:MAG: PKD domain-containing protein, partial [Cytophagales bacterium]|nr:PKD domain-containing protein [Cytophagales bacterium]
MFYSWSGGAEVYSWNKSSGTTGSLLWSNSNLGSHGGFGYGCEFSPNGNMAYFTNLNNNKLYHLDIAGNTLTDISSGGSSNNQAEMGTMQLGPDDKIYVTNVSGFAIPTYVGVISNPNNAAASCGYNRSGYTLNSGPGSYPTIFRGIANIAWLNPTAKPFLTYTNTSCGYTFSAGFKNYFNKNITASVVSWNFGDGTSGTGSPVVHTYTASGTYLVSFTIVDAACGHTWTSTSTSIVASCPTPAPVNFLNISAQLEPTHSVKVSWTTTREVNNDRFEIQRSGDGKYYFAIGHVKAGLNGDYVKDYAFTDKNPLPGKNYYRIVQYDFDGSFAVSPLVSVENHGKISVAISPNPTDNEFVLSVTSLSEARVEIMDLQGAVV